jgi:outer membrane lipoprotein-sorting protein
MLRYRYLFPALALLLVLLAACGGSSTSTGQTKPTPTPSPSPTPGPGQLLLNRVGEKLNSAKTLHGIFDLAITGQAFSGMVNIEIWNVSPNKNKTVVLQSTIAQIPAGTITDTDGKTIWQYDPKKNVVYTGPVDTSAGTATPASGFTGGSNAQTRLILTLVQAIFTRSNATIVSSNANINGHVAYDVHVVPQTGAPIGLNYRGEVYVDKQSEVPLRLDLMVSSLGHIVLDLPKLEINQPIPDSTFAFVVPPGAKELPLQQATATPGDGSITLVQAQQQAGYHLLSIPPSQTDYELEGVTALGSPGSQIFTLNYIKGNISFTISQGKPLANLQPNSGERVSVRGTTGTLTASNSSTVLAWTEKGVGIQIEGPFSKDQVIALANLLS